MESATLPATQSDLLPSDRATLIRNALLIIGATVLVHVPLIAARSADPTYVVANWQDEYNFLEHTRGIQEMIVNGDVSSLITLPLRWGYGYIFQIFYAVALLPFYLCDSFTGALVGGRLLGLLFSGIAMVYVYRILLLLTEAPRLSLFATFLMTTMQGLFVWQKLYSVDQMANCILVASFFYLCRDQLKFGRDFHRSCLLLGLAIAQKLNLAAVAPAFAAAIILGWWQDRSWSKAIRRSIQGATMVWAVFFATNFTAFISESNRQDYWSYVERAAESMQNGNGGVHPEHGNLVGRVEYWVTGARLSIDKEFLHPVLLAISCLAFVAAIAGSWTCGSMRAIRAPLIILALGFFCGVAANILSTDRVWYWHISPYFFFCLAGVMAIARLLERYRFGLVLLGASLSVLVALHIPFWLEDYATRLTEHQDARFRRLQADTFILRSQIVDLLQGVSDNKSACDLLFTNRTVEDYWFYRDRGVNTERTSRIDFAKTVRNTLPALCVIDCDRLPKRERESKLQEIRSALYAPIHSDQLGWQRYRKVYSKSGTEIYQRIDVPLTIAENAHPGDTDQDEDGASSDATDSKKIRTADASELKRR